MAIDNNAHNLIRDLVLEVKDSEPKTKQKANTVTTAIGGVATLAASGVALLLENDLGLPTWVIWILVAVGVFGTTLSVNKTTNGVTESVADRLELELARRIDLNHNHDEVIEAVTTAGSSKTETSDTDPEDLRAEAARLASGLG